MWNKIPSQQEICPSSLASRACLSHRTRSSTFTFAGCAQDVPPRQSSSSLLRCPSFGLPFWLLLCHEKCSFFMFLPPLCTRHSPVSAAKKPKEKATRRGVLVNVADIKRSEDRSYSNAWCES